ncbi:MAG: endonuclease domain-containing protein, partial [Nitrospinae bacterium]|nr:endonuclease domain-containing protein [Nitrospinota bacterium]
SEQMLWTRLRRKQLCGVQFYRQKAIDNYIVDFYAPRVKLVVEVDGSQHLDADHAPADARRDAYLEGQGVRVLRFGNLQVLGELDAVVETIFQVMTVRLAENPPSPPLPKEILPDPPLPKGGRGDSAVFKEG